MSDDKKEGLAFYEEDQEAIDRVMEEFLRLSESKCNLLVDKAGHMVTQVGSVEGIPLDTISALVAGSFAATRELAKQLGEEEFSLLFHQGKGINMQLMLVGDRSIMVTIFDERTTVGMVRLYAKQAATKLLTIMKEVRERRPSHRVSTMSAEDFRNSASSALDEIFGD